ncbi:hypothetical protein NX029_28485 [Cytobacillus firmus]|uniref:hypothetical protein n=1 Tax=Cytobacillus oceanisediminis TaxID=665099 RepID=UPI001C2321B5|nr:hypothetical protein [Cytobacillus oceanisediminis]MBU8733723.1 hypothetical protein [Cytobacillus oceanisediminis]MCS0827829.1 hypothetical protein [Cytobacillus firmus]
MFFKRKEEDEFIFETTDILIVFDNDNKTSDIKTITDFTEDSVIVAGYYKVPILDCEITTGKEGRNFFYRAPSRSIEETGRLAQLEMNMVLEQITAYKPPIPPSSMDWTKGLLFGLLFIAFIVIAVS